MCNFISFNMRYYKQFYSINLTEKCVGYIKFYCTSHGKFNPLCLNIIRRNLNSNLQSPHKIQCRCPSKNI